MVHGNGDLVGRLSSFDPDIRYMALNDILSSLDCAVLDSRLVMHIVACLVDSTPDLQNMVSKLVNKIALLSRKLASKMLEQLVELRISDPVKSMALKSIFRAGNLPAAILQQHLQSLMTNSNLFANVEGIDAVLELVKIQELPKPLNERLTAFMINLLSDPPFHLNVHMPILEVLVVLVSKCDKQFFESLVKQELITNINKTTHLSLIAKLIPVVPFDWSCPEIPSLVIEQLRLQNDIPVLELALKTLTAFAPHGLNSDQNEATIQLVKQFVCYTEFGDDEELSDSESEGSNFEDSESAWFDESTCVRQAACQLAAATKNSECLQVLLNTCPKEQDEPTKLELYHSIYSLSTLNVPNEDLGNAFEKFALKNIRKNHLIAAAKALSYQLKTDGFVSPETVLALMQRKKSLAYDFIPYMRFDDQTPENLRAILQQLFKEAESSTDISDHLIKGAIQQACDMKFYDFIGAIELVLTRTPSESVRVACLTSMPSFLMGVNDNKAESIIRQTLNYIASNTSKTGINGNGLLSALKILQAFAAQRPKSHSDNLSMMIMSGVGDILVSKNEEMSEELANECCDMLCNVQDAQFAQLAPFIFQVCDSRLTMKIENRLMQSSALVADFRALDWAIKNQGLKLIKLRAAIPGQFEETVSTCLTRSNCYRVHAAAASGTETGWTALTNRYFLGVISFGDLNEMQLQLLLDLARYRSRWAWFSLDEMLEATQNTLQSEVFGSITAISSGIPVQDAPKFISLNRACRRVAFASYTSLLQDPFTILEMMNQFPELQIPEAAGIAVCNETMFQNFIEKFSSNPRFLVRALEKVDFPGFRELAFPLLRSYVISMENECSVRSDALACIRWKLAREKPVSLEYLERTLDLAISVLVPDANFVKTISIGPFKHKVDALLRLRYQALETLYMYLVPNITLFDDKLLSRVTNCLVYNSLNDNEYDVKLLAYRLLTSMTSESIVVRMNISRDNPTIVEDINRKPKDSAVKDDVEKIFTLAKVASMLQSKLID